MDWRKHILGSQSTGSDITFQFNLYTEDSQFEKLKKQFELLELPFEFAELYKETNGVNECLNGRPIGEFIWPIERVIETNKE